jgi:hypothetical protein
MKGQMQDSANAGTKFAPTYLCLREDEPQDEQALNLVVERYPADTTGSETGFVKS